MRTYILVLFLCPLAVLISEVESTVIKVVVPSVYKEWLHGLPHWILDKNLQSRLNYTVYLYQKLNRDAPNYIATNRGTEGGVFLRYIVDHYNGNESIFHRVIHI